MPVRIVSDLMTILPLLKTKLTATDHLYLTNCVSLTLADDLDVVTAAPSDRFLILRPIDYPVSPGLAAGAGREAMLHDGTLEVSLFCRLNLDRQGDDEQYLLNPTNGILRAWAETLQSLHMFDPLNSDMTPAWVLSQPMRCVRWSNRPKRGITKEPGWGKLESQWELKFTQRLDYPARASDNSEAFT